MDLKITPWTKKVEPTETELRAELAEQDLNVYNWSNLPDDVYPSHTHGYHKVLYVVDGTIRFDFPTRSESYNLQAGDRLDLPAGIRHSATVGPDGVSCLESHIY